MKRVIVILLGMAVVVGALAAISAGMYLVGYLAEGLLQGGSRIANIIFLVLLVVMVMATFLTLAERKWSAMMQDRVGPNRARIGLPGLKNRVLFGIPHIAADVLKMLWKEDFIPAAARSSRFLFNIAPLIGFVVAFVLFAVIPVGPDVVIGDRTVHAYISDPDFGVLYIFAIASLAVYSTSIAGWASNNKFSLLGGVRASAQMISYEVALGLGLVGMMMVFETVRLGQMAQGQGQLLWTIGDGAFGLPAWGILLQPVGFLVFFAAAFAETKRAPFDAPEGESEILGYFVEYSGMKFGLFMIAEFVEIVVLSAVCVVIFFGAWHIPFVDPAWLKSQLVGPGQLFGSHEWLWGTLLATVFWIKVLMLCWLQLAVRWSFPRFRYDQIQNLGWKMLLPLGLANVFISGMLILWDPGLHALAIFGMIILLALVLLTVLGGVAPTAPAPAHGHGHAQDDHAAPAPSGH